MRRSVSYLQKLLIFCFGIVFLVALCAINARADSLFVAADWYSGALTVEKIKDATYDGTNASLYDNIPTVPTDYYSLDRITTDFFGKDVWTKHSMNMQQQGSRNYLTADGKLLPIGGVALRQLSFGSLYYSWAYMIPGTNSLVVATCSYGYSCPGGATLSIIDDIDQSFSQDTTSKSTYNLIKSPDYTLHDETGTAITPYGGYNFSDNGKWLLLDSSKGQLRFNTATKEIFPFYSYQSNQYAPRLAISNAGQYVAKFVPMSSFYLYDLTKCDSTKTGTQNRNCQRREMYWQLNDAINTIEKSNVQRGTLQITNIKFVNENKMAVMAGYRHIDNNSFTYSLYYVTVPSSSAVEPKSYLAMGDSFASGEGIYDYRSDTNFYVDKNTYNLCHQSTKSYSYILSADLGIDTFGSVACSGARMPNINKNIDSNPISPNYLQASGYMDIDNTKSRAVISDSFLPGYLGQRYFVNNKNPSVVTLSIGGNDVGFGDIIKACIINKFNPLTGNSKCYSGRNDREKLANEIDQKIPELTATYKAILGSMSGNEPRLYIVGYPKMVNPDGFCPLSVPLSQTEQVFADHLVEYLNEAIKVASQRAGVRYIDVSNVFIDADHDYRLCGIGKTIAVNGVSMTGESAIPTGEFVDHESFHPNLLGHKLEALRIKELTNNFTAKMPLVDISQVKPTAYYRNLFVGDTNITVTDTDTNYVAQNQTSILFTDKSEVVNLSLNTASSTFATGTAARVELHSEPIWLGDSVVDSAGNITKAITIPIGTPYGYHQLHVFVRDIDGRKHDFYSYIFVAVSPNDYDGDGIENKNEPCTIGMPSGIDADKDGIDDICDNEYTEKPAVIVPSNPTNTGNVSIESIDTNQEDPARQALGSVSRVLGVNSEVNMIPIPQNPTDNTSIITPVLSRTLDTSQPRQEDGNLLIAIVASILSVLCLIGIYKVIVHK